MGRVAKGKAKFEQLFGEEIYDAQATDPDLQVILRGFLNLID